MAQRPFETAATMTQSRRLGLKYPRISWSLLTVLIFVFASLKSSNAADANNPTATTAGQAVGSLLQQNYNLWFTGGAAAPNDSPEGDTATATDHDDDTSSLNTFQEDVVNVVPVRKQRNDNGESRNANDATTDKVTFEDEQEEVEQERGSKSLRDTMTKKKLQFLDRIALVSSSLMRSEADAAVETTESSSDAPLPHKLQDVTPQSDLTLPGRHFHIVTTAALPWFTGTAVNPLLRAAHLHRRTQEINLQALEAAAVDNKNNNETSTRWVTLVIPWLELPEDQESLYGRMFASQAHQETFIRNWLAQEAGMPDAACPDTGLQILFYPARYHAGLGSIFAMGDIIGLLPPDKMDVCVLEEPEHCNWFRAPGDGWTKRFRFVVGVVHTNYKEYASSHYSGLWTAPAISVLSSAMVRAYCHKVIKLSAVLQSYAPEKEETSNVHGVRDDFLNEGKRRAEQANSTVELDEDSVGVYFIGKLLWAKGLDLMLEMEDYYKQCTDDYFEIDIFGSGPDQKDIIKAFHGRRKDSTERSSVLAKALSLGGGTASKSKASSNETSSDAVNGNDDDSPVESVSREGLKRVAKQKLKKIKQTIKDVEIPKTFAELRRQPIPARFPGRVDHGTLTKKYRVFVNPSVSEVLCTTTAEALAMGKFAIIPLHPSNTFFLQFPNCLAYRNKFEFVANLRWALTHEPEPLTPVLARQFTWQAATDRFIEASAITWQEAIERERLGMTKLDERIAWFHGELGKGATGDLLRKICGAGPVSHQVKYQSQQQEGLASLDDSDEEGADEDEDDGLSGKFRRSSFAEAIRVSLGDLSMFMQ